MIARGGVSTILRRTAALALMIALGSCATPERSAPQYPTVQRVTAPPVRRAATQQAQRTPQPVGLAALQEEVTDVLCLIEVENNEVVASPVRTERAGGGGAGFFVRCLSMDDGCHLLASILSHTFPDAHHIAACGVYDMAAAFLDCINGHCLGSECGHDDNIFLPQRVQVLLRRARGEMPDPEGGHLRVDVRVVDDLPEQKNPPVREAFSSGIGKIDRALDPVAKPKLFREADCRLAGLQHAATRTQPLDKLAPIMSFNLRLHVRHDVRRAQVDAGPGAQAVRQNF